MWPNPKFPADLVIFPEEILNGKFHFLCSVKGPAKGQRPRPPNYAKYFLEVLPMIFSGKIHDQMIYDSKDTFKSSLFLLC